MVETLAGNELGFSNGTGTAARFWFPPGVVVDGSGNLYVADENNHAVRKITSAGVVTTLAGSGLPGFNNATGDSAQFNYPKGLGVDTAGNVYVADTSNHRIRKITPAGVVTTLAGSGSVGSAEGTGAAASFSAPAAIAVDASGVLYVADRGNNKIRRVTSTGVVTTFASGFGSPYGVAVDASGNVYVADTDNHRIAKISPAGAVSTLAGGALGSNNGTGAAAQFFSPAGVSVDKAGTVYVADTGNNLIRKITSAGVVTTLAGDGTAAFRDGEPSQAWFSAPWGVTVDGNGNVYVADQNNHRIRKILP